MNNFRHRNLYNVFVKQNHTGFRSAKEFETAFKEVMKPNISSNKYNTEYLQKLDKEMQKFNGKVLVGDGTETNSEMTTGTKITKKSGQGASKNRGGSPGPDELDEAATFEDGQPRPATADAEPHADDDANEEEIAAREAAKKNQDSPLKHLFKDADG